MRTKSWLILCGTLAFAGLGCAKGGTETGAPSGSASAGSTPAVSAAGRGLSAAENDPQYAALAAGFKACKEINTNCATYAKKDDVGKNATTPEARAKARATFLNWIEEPGSWQIRNAGAHVLWTQYLVDDAAAADSAATERVAAALKAEPKYGKESENKYTAVQIADVLVRYAKNATGRVAVTAFIADKTYAFPAARAELIRLMDGAVLNEAKVFATLKAVAEDKSDDATVREAVRDSLARASGENLAWAQKWLSQQATEADAVWAGNSARTLAQIGTAETYAALVAELGKRIDNKDYSYYGGWALQQYLRRTDLTLDKKPGVKVATAIANNGKFDVMTRAVGLEALLASGDASFKPLATKFSKGPDKDLAKRAGDLLKRQEESEKAKGAAKKK